MKKNIYMFCVVLCASLIAFGLTGCKKDVPADVTETPKVQDTPEDPAIDQELKKTQTEAEDELTQIVSEMFNDAGKSAYIQTKCPIMGNDISKDIFVEYQGKKVYFCCSPCKDKFNADPEKYLPRLPQFKE